MILSKIRKLIRAESTKQRKSSREAKLIGFDSIITFNRWSTTIWTKRESEPNEEEGNFRGCPRNEQVNQLGIFFFLLRLRCVLLDVHWRYSWFLRFHGCCFSTGFCLYAVFLIDFEQNSHSPAFCSGFGAAYGTAKAGVGVMASGVMRPELVMRNVIPVVMAGVLAIYGLIIAVIIGTTSLFLFFSLLYSVC